MQVVNVRLSRPNTARCPGCSAECLEADSSFVVRLEDRVEWSDAIKFASLFFGGKKDKSLQDHRRRSTRKRTMLATLRVDLITSAVSPDCAALSEMSIIASTGSQSKCIDRLFAPRAIDAKYSKAGRQPGTLIYHCIPTFLMVCRGHLGCPRVRL